MKTLLTSIAVAALAAVSSPVSAQTDLLAYWAQNDNDLPGGGFGFQPGDFPQAADDGLLAGNIALAALTVGGGILDETMVNANGDLVYRWVQSFGGTTENALPGYPSGGSIAIQGGTDFANNGSWIQWQIDMTDYQDLIFSFAGRGTAAGFNSSQVSYSFDGISFFDFGDPYDQRGEPVGTWRPFEFDFGSLLDDQPSAFIRITMNGATHMNGNNGFDNIQFNATLIPAPGTLALLGLTGLAIRRRR